MLITIIQWMFDFGICLGVNQKIYHYVCYCKKENDISFFQKTGKSAQTPDYNTPKKIIRKYFFKMRSCRLYWKVLFSLSLTWNMKGLLCISNKLFRSWGLCTSLFLFPDWLPKYIQLYFFSLLMGNCLFSLVEKQKTNKQKNKEKKEAETGLQTLG